MPKKNIAIIGATGFTGSELVRILHLHPEVNISLITSESRAGEKFSDVHPFFRGIVDQQLYSVNDLDQFEVDLAFLALPHGVSMEYVEKFDGHSFPIVDLSGDYRLNNPETYEAWYNKKHSFTKAFEYAAYGIPELYRDKIKKARLVANPGCYPTSVILGAAPLIDSGLVHTDRIISDSKSGITGAGVKAKTVNHYSNVNDNFKAYGIKTHRHSIEIQENFERLGDTEVKVQFTPHLLPIDRGILSTIYLQPKSNITEGKIKEIYEDFYKDGPFIRLLDQAPAVKNVRGTNYCDIYTTYDERTNNIMVFSAIDNLVKGAAGQAVQNMNLLFGWNEALGLNQIPLCP
ncbi:N-acetyl-gamma-glutamyl-phosphate reductase [bacterium]|nr:N-acetyl-gamma-glutamyl-phosphate reductase [bacterium]